MGKKNNTNNNKKITSLCNFFKEIEQHNSNYKYLLAPILTYYFEHNKKNKIDNTTRNHYSHYYRKDSVARNSVIEILNNLSINPIPQMLNVTLSKIIKEYDGRVKETSKGSFVNVYSLIDTLKANQENTEQLVIKFNNNKLMSIVIPKEYIKYFFKYNPNTDLVTNYTPIFKLKNDLEKDEKIPKQITIGKSFFKDKIISVNTALKQNQEIEIFFTKLKLGVQLLEFKVTINNPQKAITEIKKEIESARNNNLKDIIDHVKEEKNNINIKFKDYHNKIGVKGAEKNQICISNKKIDDKNIDNNNISLERIILASFINDKIKINYPNKEILIKWIKANKKQLEPLLKFAKDTGYGSILGTAIDVFENTLKEYYYKDKNKNNEIVKANLLEFDITEQDKEYEANTDRKKILKSTPNNTKLQELNKFINKQISRNYGAGSKFIKQILLFEKTFFDENKTNKDDYVAFKYNSLKCDNNQNPILQKYLPDDIDLEKLFFSNTEGVKQLRNSALHFNQPKALSKYPEVEEFVGFYTNTVEIETINNKLNLDKKNKIIDNKNIKLLKELAISIKDYTSKARNEETQQQEQLKKLNFNNNNHSNSNSQGTTGTATNNTNTSKNNNHRHNKNKFKSQANSQPTTHDLINKFNNNKL